MLASQRQAGRTEQPGVPDVSDLQLSAGQEGCVLGAFPTAAAACAAQPQILPPGVGRHDRRQQAVCAGGDLLAATLGSNVGCAEAGTASR